MTILLVSVVVQEHFGGLSINGEPVGNVGPVGNNNEVNLYLARDEVISRPFLQEPLLRHSAYELWPSRFRLWERVDRMTFCAKVKLRF